MAFKTKSSSCNCISNKVYDLNAQNTSFEQPKSPISLQEKELPTNPLNIRL